MGNTYKLIAMLLAEGALEILTLLGKSKVVHFKDFRKLKNERTNKNFSANTLSIRLKELEKLGAIKRVPAVTDLGRNAVAYSLTQKGIKTLEVSSKYEQELAKILN